MRQAMNGPHTSSTPSSTNRATSIAAIRAAYAQANPRDTRQPSHESRPAQPLEGRRPVHVHVQASVDAQAGLAQAGQVVSRRFPASGRKAVVLQVFTSWGLPQMGLKRP